MLGCGAVSDWAILLIPLAGMLGMFILSGLANSYDHERNEE